MTRSCSGFLGLSVLLAPLGACATAPNTGGGAKPLASSPAAELPGPGWLLLGTHGESAVFMHPLSTLRVGNSAFIMVVVSKRQPAVLSDGVTLGSLKERIEIDCEGRRYRRHDGTVHPDQAALGPVLARVGQDKWNAVPANTVMAVVSRAVCSDAAPPGALPPSAPNLVPDPAVPRFPPKRGGTFST